MSGIYGEMTDDDYNYDDYNDDEEVFDENEFYDQSESDEGCDFADPGGNSALRAATEDNPRNLPCPCCGDENALTPKDRALGYICNPCADQAERGGP